MNPDSVEMLDQTPAPISSASAPASGRDTKDEREGLFQLGDGGAEGC